MWPVDLKLIPVPPALGERPGAPGGLQQDHPGRDVLEVTRWRVLVIASAIAPRRLSDVAISTRPVRSRSCIRPVPIPMQRSPRPQPWVDPERCPEAQMSSLVYNPALYVTGTSSDRSPPLLRACLGARNHTTELALRAAPPTGRFTVVPAFPILVANEPDADRDVDRCPFSAGRSLSAALDADPEATRPVAPVAVEGRPAPKPSGRLVCDLRGDVRAAVCACVDREGGT